MTIQIAVCQQCETMMISSLTVARPYLGGDSVTSVLWLCPRTSCPKYGKILEPRWTNVEDHQ